MRLYIAQHRCRIRNVGGLGPCERTQRQNYARDKQCFNQELERGAPGYTRISLRSLDRAHLLASQCSIAQLPKQPSDQVKESGVQRKPKYDILSGAWNY